jgi:hypothetical protein
MRRSTRCAALAASLGVFIACSGTPGSKGLDVASALSGPRSRVVLAEGLRIDVPSGWTVTAVSATTDTPFANAPSTCNIGTGSITSPTGSSTVTVTVVMAANECSTGTPEPLPINGRHGAYVRLLDVPSPQGVVTAGTDVGTVSSFTQIYSEYTNSRRDFTDAVALVQLTNPPSGDRPTVMLVTNADQVTPAQLAVLASRITAA